MLMSVRNIAAPKEDEVIIGEGSIADKGVGSVVKGNGEMTKVGGGPRGDGVIEDGEGNWC